MGLPGEHGAVGDDAHLLERCHGHHTRSEGEEPETYDVDLEEQQRDGREPECRANAEAERVEPGDEGAPQRAEHRPVHDDVGHGLAVRPAVANQQARRDQRAQARDEAPDLDIECEYEPLAVRIGGGGPLERVVQQKREAGRGHARD